MKRLTKFNILSGLISIFSVIAVVLLSFGEIYDADPLCEDSRFAVAILQERMSVWGQSLKGLTASVATVGYPGDDAFQQQVLHSYSQEDFDFVQGVGYSAFIPAHQLSNHESYMRKKTSNESYSVKPLGTRDEYTAITWMYPPDEENMRAIGYDMFSDPVRREAMKRARSEKHLAMTGKVKLVQDAVSEDVGSVLLYSPIYSNVSFHSQEFLGYVFAPIRVKDLVKIFGDQFHKAHSLKIEDITDTEAKILFQSREHYRREKNKVLEFFGRKWMLTIGHSHAAYDRVKIFRWTAAFMCLVVTCLGIFGLRYETKR